MLNKTMSFKGSKLSVTILMLILMADGTSAHATESSKSSSKGYVVCVNAKTKVMTHASTSKCSKGSKKIVLGARGVQGATGLVGATGLPGKDGKTMWSGVKDPETTLGTSGDMYINVATKTLFGPKDSVSGWPVGVSLVGAAGPSGATGPKGDSGSNGASSVKIAELSICGSGGTSLCKIGEQGPGGGLIFFVDYNDQYSGFNYLEAAPKTCEKLAVWNSDASSVTDASGWAAREVGRGQSNTAAIILSDADSATVDNNAAYYADTLTAYISTELTPDIPATCDTPKSDWFLGSIGEMMLMYHNLQGLGEFESLLTTDEPAYWSSTQAYPNSAWHQHFDNGTQTAPQKFQWSYVRPVRSF